MKIIIMKYIYIILSVMILFSCNNKTTTQEADDSSKEQEGHIVITSSQFQSGNMRLDTLSFQNFNDIVVTTGYIDVPPKNKASVSTFIGGYVKHMPLLVGDVVKRGQLVAVLENTEIVEIQQDYLEVFEKLTYLKSEFERQEALYNEGITSQKIISKQKAITKAIRLITAG